MSRDDAPTRREAENDYALDLLDWAREHRPDLLDGDEDDMTPKEWLDLMRAITDARYAAWAAAWVIKAMGRAVDGPDEPAPF